MKSTKKLGMKGFLGLTKRHLSVFFKDKQSVVFSMLTSIILLILYLLFLKGSFVDSMNSILNGMEGVNLLITTDDINMFANLFLVTGILGSAMITVPYNCLTMIVKDRENKIDYDVLATPIKRGQIVLSYFTSAALSSIIMNMVIVTVGLIALRLQGSLYMGVTRVLATYGVVALGSVSATAVFMLIILFFKSSRASGAFFGILSAASGFVIGAYVPISTFSDSVQTVCNLFPASHVTMILRNTLMNGILDHMDSSLNGIDEGKFTSALREAFSFKANMFGTSLNVGQMLIYVLIGIIICISVLVAVYSKTYKKK